MQLFISRMPKMCAIPQLVSVPLTTTRRRTRTQKTNTSEEKNQEKYSPNTRVTYLSAFYVVILKRTPWKEQIQGSVMAMNNDDDSREFKKLRRQLQRKRHIKTELCVNLSLLRLFHVDHVVQNRRTALSLAWYEWFSCKGKEWKIYCCDPALSSESQIWKFHVVVWETTS